MRIARVQLIAIRLHYPRRYRLRRLESMRRLITIGGDHATLVSISWALRGKGLVRVRIRDVVPDSALGSVFGFGVWVCARISNCGCGCAHRVCALFLRGVLDAQLEDGGCDVERGQPLPDNAAQHELRIEEGSLRQDAGSAAQQWWAEEVVVDPEEAHAVTTT